jgi:SAM-dependent methyltransferase
MSNVFAPPVDLRPDAEILAALVDETYARVARSPYGEFHFHTGANYALDRLGYDAGELLALPVECTARFAGLGNPLADANLRPGEVLLDAGCGAGTDLLLAAWRVGPEGCAFGVEPNPAMRAIAQDAVSRQGLAHCRVLDGSLEYLPLPDESVDVAIANATFSLCPAREEALVELRRVLRPGGRLVICDAVVDGRFPAHERVDPALWAS